MSESLRKYVLIGELSEAIKVPVSTIRFWVFTKKIPFVKVGKSVRFDPEKINKWLLEQENLSGGVIR